MILRTPSINLQIFRLRVHERQALVPTGGLYAENVLDPVIYLHKSLVMPMHCTSELVVEQLIRCPPPRGN